jgi:hypothetical protein
VLIVHTREGAVQTAVNRAIDSEEQLVRWLSAVFTSADWQPEALVVVGSGGDLEALMPWLEDVLSVPVFAPAEAELALARGAALASAHNADFAFADDAQGTRERRSGDRRRPLAQTGPLTLLVAGVLTFVVSLSVAISLQLTPEKDRRTPEARNAANTPAETPAAVHLPPVVAPRVAVPAPAAVTPLAPPPEAPPVEIAPQPVEVPVEQPVRAPEAPVVADAPPVDPAVPVAPAPLDPAIPAPALAPLPPLPGQVAAPPVAPEPVERPGILRRLKDRLSDIGPDDEVPPGETLPPAPPVPLTELPPPPPPP